MSSTLSHGDVLKIAELARIALTPDEVERFTEQLGAILNYANEIADVDTAGVAPTSHALAGADAWREDVPVESLPRTASLRNAPDAAPGTGLFKVPKVL